ncbi:MAG: 8-amino-7-oxononanoate synthase [Bacteroidetes bacterium SW_10_40_5]|jgi:glycine C-acetyltransferase|nr:MAG: 8-amino-7-oxononanoate synthase [Bacteroidetes bacterium SW_10_40_5]
MDIFKKLQNNKGPLGAYAKNAHGYFTFPKLEGPIINRMNFRGGEMIVWSLNNYLGLADHPEVRKTDQDASEESGLAAPMGARMMSGNSNKHEELERQLSEFVQKEDTFLMNYGYQGVFSAIDALLDRKDVVIYDSECHACVIDGVRLHQGKRFTFVHNDLENLEKQLQRAQKLVNDDEGGILVISEGVFGMSGEQGKLKEIAELKNHYNFRFFVDDAHGFGTMGATGAGTGEEQHVQEDIDVYFSTFAKSMASIGAFISSSLSVTEYLRYNTRSQIFAKSMPFPLVIGNMKRLQLLRENPELKDQLWDNVRKLQNGLKERNFSIGNTSSPVTPVYLSGTVNEASNLIMDLRENYGVFCSMVIYPVVPKGVMLLRLIPTAVHTNDDIQRTLDAFTAVSDKLKHRKYQKAILV